jgi:predicted RNA polymerase sigma factor
MNCTITLSAKQRAALEAIVDLELYRRFESYSKNSAARAGILEKFSDVEQVQNAKSMFEEINQKEADRVSVASELLQIVRQAKKSKG